MRGRFEFTFVEIGSDLESGDAKLALLGSLGWELRGIAARGHAIVAALQRSLDEERVLPDAGALAMTLEEPLVAPDAEELDTA